ncbi:hypothetical protein E1B28_001045 [Marasmius oreades]|uniref:Uncharacterized protein n=1 Tax=Marasmius oreades TaxID=181124 RepID=A0A9P7V2L3_9AGAR|nr:uncharacterized protein E1B28_001045 [Marasmius oreades]KAG7099174.1 hypothetical protein E1B28_001045 [Marasmius oreades]
MSTLPRSKSAPQPLPALSACASTNVHSLPRSASHQTIQPKAKSAPMGAVRPTNRALHSPRIEREQPFNLAGFFPTGTLGEMQNEASSWWLREGDEESEGQSWCPAVAEAGTEGMVGQISDEMTRAAIKNEDKMGILSFGNFFARKDDGRQERLLSPYSDDEPVDHESLYLSLCARRRAQGIESVEGRFGELFL